MPKKKLNGVVVSDKSQKTIIVKVQKLIYNAKYRKRYFKSKKYHVHDEKNEYKVGDQVILEEVRPLSKRKRWKVSVKQ